jgi:hypothetical protein
MLFRKNEQGYPGDGYPGDLYPGDGYPAKGYFDYRQPVSAVNSLPAPVITEISTWPGQIAVIRGLNLENIVTATTPGA